MKKLLTVCAIAVSSLALVSCGGSSSALLEKASTELCGCMDKMNENPMDGATCMQEFGTKEEYQKIGQDEFMKAMKKKCPDAAKKFEELAGGLGG